MRAWEQTPSAWLDHPGAWQPAGRDETVQAGESALGARALAARAAGGLHVPAGCAALGLSRPEAGVFIDAVARTAGDGRMDLLVHRAANRYEGWRERLAGHSGASLAVFRESRPATPTHVRSSL